MAACTAVATRFMGGWYWNPTFGMYSYVPGMGGMFYSPYGNPFFSPFDVAHGRPSSTTHGYYGYYRIYGNYGYSDGYSGVYNSVNYKSVPVPSGSKGSAVPRVRRPIAYRSSGPRLALRRRLSGLR